MQTTIDTVKLAFLAKPDARKPGVTVPAPVAYLRIRPGVKLNGPGGTPPNVAPAQKSGPPSPGGPPLKNSDRRILPGWKRAMDILIVMAFLPLITLVGLAVALIIKCGSPGPILFCQNRVGYRGRTFKFYKFRTMRVAAGENSHRQYTRELMNANVPMTKLDVWHDSRIVPFGGVLRACGLDELPQLINVLLGDMTIVGPRPCIPYEFDLYTPEQLRRFEAVPGLTGLWQVNGKNRTTFRRMIELDVEYLDRRSLWLDLKIIARTLPALWQQCLDAHARKSSSPPVAYDALAAAADHL